MDNNINIADLHLSNVMEDETEFIPLLSAEDEEIINAEDVPPVLPILPLRNTVLFPGVVIPITVGRDKSIRLIKEFYKGERIIGVVSQIDGDIEDPGYDDLNKTGTVAYIIKILQLPDGNTTAIIQGKKRFELGKLLQSEPYFKAEVRSIDQNVVVPKKDKNFEGNDIREGLTSVVSVTVPEKILQFEGQTKGKLGTPDAKSAVENFVSEKLMFYLEENRDFATMILKKIQKASQAREAARKAREDARKGKKNGRSERILSGKLSPAQSKDSRKNELFLVEGDSAGGSAKQGRDSKYQAILPLRGKVLNTEKASLGEIEKNEELNTIIHALGAGAGSDFEVEDCNYGKVILMTDADTDGAHIQVLLLTFFYRYMRTLIETGHVYIAQPPLFKITRGKTIEYAYDES